jgi:hypothetical protein
MLGVLCALPTFNREQRAAGVYPPLEPWLMNSY